MPRGIPNRLAQVSGEPGEKPAPVQPTARAEETRRARRRRDDANLDRMAGLKLAIPHDIQEQANREGKVLRWVLDTPGRMQQMQADDWDKVPEVASVAANRDTDEQLVLCSKYKDWYDADQQATANVLNEQEKSLKRGEKISPDDKRQQSTSYVVPGNRISRERGA